MLEATCHCGAVAIEIHAPLTAVTECNCSICRRYATRWAYFTQGTTRVKAAPGSTEIYMWGDRMVEFHRCRACGCVTHYEGLDKGPESRVVVNARMLPPESLDGVRIRHFDGADTWSYLEG